MVMGEQQNVNVSEFHNSFTTNERSNMHPSMPILRRNKMELSNQDESSKKFQRKIMSFGGRTIHNEERDIEKIIKSNLRFQSKVTKSAVVLVSNLNCSTFGVENMYNLASTCGNIKVLLMMRNLNKCLIEYKSKDFAHVGITMLNNQFFLGEKLKVNFSKYSKIDLRKNNRSGNSEKYNQVKKVAKKEWRYPMKKNASNITFLSPSVYLLFKIFQNKSKSISHELVFQKIKQEKFEPVQIKIVENKMADMLKEEYTKRSIWKSFKDDMEILLSIYKFKNLQESMYILSKLHNLEIKGKKLNVSFSFFKF